jgi:RND family efflux transporter MFP subunit
MGAKKGTARRLFKLAVYLLTAGVAICAAVYAHSQSGIVTVKTEAVSRGAVRETVDETGSVASRRVSALAAKRSYMITSLKVRLGSDVKSGDVLLLTDRTYDAAGVRGMRARAEGLNARIAQAQREADRLRTLARSKAASAQDAERAAMAVSDLRAQLREVRFDIEDALNDAPESAVRAPVPGLVTELFVAQGDTVAQGAPLMELTDMKALYIKADLIENDAAKVKTGDLVLFASGGEGRVTRMDAKVREVLSELGVTQKRVTVEIEAKNYPRLGADVDLSIVTDERENILLVPRKAVFSMSGRDFAFVVRGEIAEMREIMIGLRGRAHYEVTGGLSEDDEVVIAPDAKLADGGRIRRE